MGLFDIFKKKKKPMEFYDECVKDYHETAKKLGYAERDLIFVPELLAYGQKALLWFYKDEALQHSFDNPVEYYYVAVNTAIRCGLIFALKWHTDFSELQKPYYVDTVMEKGPSVFSNHIVQNDLKMNTKEFADFCAKIFLRWKELHEPYWKLKDCRDYTFNATLAAYQLGISMTLCKYGY